MSPERSEQIKRIVRSALGRPAAERSAFLDGACAEDEELRAAVESALASRGEGTDGEARPASVSAETTRAEVVPGRTSLGPYRVLEKLGAGGMGTVYLALDTRLGRRVALKLLPVHMASDEESVRRFEQEARAASALNHPNILTVHDIGELDGRRFIATEYVEGRDLRQRAAESPLSLTEALEVCAQAASALVKAHAAGIIHRDVKPENVMVDEEGHVKVLDFGIAKRFAPRRSPDPEAPTSAQVNTESGVVLGTSTYMSPEQVRGLELDARTDVWSLGCVLYEMIAGRPPFGAHTYGDLVVAILHEEPPPLAGLRPGAPEELERIVRKALAKRREDRYQSARELQTDLRRLKSHLDFRQGAGVAHDLALAPPAAPHARATTTEQRKQVTVLFADASGLAELAGGADAEELSELLEELWGRVRRVVEEHGGALTKSVGDTVLALWGAREAREDDPEQAVRAALSMRHEAAEVARLHLHTSEAVAPSLMRAGVSTGLVLLGELAATGELTATGEP
ncbi:MAG TPA: protein kinase, partial [Pyrinomonadaceae bacterium]|nr:protein kinase [Pyrinomonadaceae bacterium]